MSKERTFSIIKPDAVASGKTGAILQHLIDGGLRPVAMKLMHMSEAQARGFYHVHRERPFFGDLVKFMTSGPCVVQVLEGDNAIAKNRELMGATDSKKAAAGTTSLCTYRQSSSVASVTGSIRRSDTQALNRTRDASSTGKSRLIRVSRSSP